MKRPKVNTVFKILGVYLLFLLVIEGFGQIFIRYTEKKSPSGIYAEDILSHREPVLGFALKKNLNHSMSYWTVKTNKHGFRDDQELKTPKEKDETRVFVVGGSTVFGWGVEHHETIPSHLQKLFNKELTTKKFRVINAGVPWYASWHETALILFRILNLEPDAIIVLNGLNDAANSMAPFWTPIHEGFVDIPTQIASEHRDAAQSLGSLWLDFFKISPLFRYTYSKLKARKTLSEGAYHPDVWIQYESYWNRINLITKQLNIRFHVFMQPVIVLNKPITKDEFESNASGLKDPTFAANFQKIYLEGEKRLEKQSSFPFKSLVKIFKNEKNSIYLDGLHYTSLGNELLARKIFEIITLDKL